MAWVSMKKRAEDILNQIDHTAATVLVSNQGSAQTQGSRNVERDNLTEVKCLREPSPDRDLIASPSVISAIEQAVSSNANLTIEDELATAKITLVNIQGERDELKAEVSALLDQIHNRNNGKQRLVEMDRELIEAKDENTILIMRNRELTADLEQQRHLVSELQISNAQLRQNLIENQDKLSCANDEVAKIATELANYRSRAQSSLQLKENIIDELRLASGNTDSPSAAAFDLEIEQLKDERKELLAELQKLQSTSHGYQEQIRKLDEKLASAGRESALHSTRTADELQRAGRAEKELRQEVVLLSAELQAVRMQSQKFNEKLVQQMYEKDQEIAGLRKRANAYQDPGNLDSRIKSLTQSLIQKQTSLEEATADRNALKIQLEKMEVQCRNLGVQLQRCSAADDGLGRSMTDDDKAQLPLFMQESPFDNRVAKRMKRVIKVSDSLLGVFLLRHPLIRITVLFYIVLLHIWVMVVLISSTPNQL